MAESSKEWIHFQVRRDEWEQRVVSLERATVAERAARWEMNEAAQALMNARKAPNPNIQVAAE